MPMPHEEMRRLIKRRIRGKDGSERINALKACLDLLPGYYSGPYGELRKWVTEEIAQARVRKQSRHTDALAIPRQGDAQIVLLGPPNAGKSSLLKVLCGRQVAVGNYPFTTLRPIAATALINHAHIQLVEIPGLIEGAHLGRGGGKQLLACARNADGLIYVLPLDDDGVGGLRTVMQEVAQLNLELPPLIVCTKNDLPGADAVWRMAQLEFADQELISVSAGTGSGLPELRAAIWEMSDLMRVFPRRNNQSGTPFILPRESTLRDFARAVHREMADRVSKGRVFGASAKFPGQLVGPDHVLLDGDQVEIIV